MPRKLEQLIPVSRIEHVRRLGSRNPYPYWTSLSPEGQTLPNVGQERQSHPKLKYSRPNLKLRSHNKNSVVAFAGLEGHCQVYF